MNARYALINATTPRIVRRSTSVDGGREKKEKEKKRARRKVKKGKREKRMERMARWTTSSSAEAPIKFHLAVQSPARIASCRCYFLFVRGGELICANDTLSPCLPASLPCRAFYSLPVPRISPSRDLVTFGRSLPVSWKRLVRETFNSGSMR